MRLSERIIRSKLTPPQVYRTIFNRPRLQEKLAASIKYPITLVHAGTGFGKTTALVELSGLYKRVYWYKITESDRDPTLFLAHLISAFLPETQYLLDRLESNSFTSADNIINALINQLTTDLEDDAVLILDDYHLVNNVPAINKWIETLVEQRPPRFRIAIASRQITETPAFIRWRVKGNVLIIDQQDLSFTQDEISSLFSNHHSFPITEEQTYALFSYTDGWIIALEMVWQRLQTSKSKKLDNILAALPTALSDIFNFLASEVLLRQPENIQQFLTSTAVLRQMDSEICNSLLGIQDSQTILQTLVEKGLFISTVDNSSFHFQRLFQDFLLAQLNETPQNWKELHQKAADYFTRIGDYEEAIFHRISTGELSEAARLIALIGPKLLESGWLSTLSTWIEELSDHELEKKPDLYLLQGDAFRLCSNFENSIISYNNAEKVYLRLNDLPGRSRALRSKAQVYLDTIRPLKASSLLEEAIALLEPQEHPAEVADLLDQLAENKLNLGRPEEARELHNEAGLLRSESAPDDIYLEARSLLTGRLIEGCALLENYGLENEKSNTNRPQRFHREMSLLQSLIYIMLGDIQKGEYFARQGIETGKQLDSPFVEAVGLMRLGHAYQLSPQVPWRKEHTQRSREYYERSIELVKPFNVVRVQVEPLWGLCRFHGYQGNIAEALRIARQAIEISETSGDNWFAALLRTTMGTAYVLAGEAAQAEAWLTQSIDGFVQVGDTFGQSTASCTRLLNYWMSGKKDKALSGLETIAPHLQHLNLNFLLTRPTHLGLQDTQAFLPFLVEAQNLTGIKEWVAQILEEQGLSGIDFHPGYGLDISCMGHFEVWRGKDLLSLRDWQRDKARQLFQFLVVGRGDWFAREQISEQLWPELDPVSSAQNLKAALNALNRAIEPKRESGKKPFFVIRRDNLYGLNPAAQIMVDTDDFFVLSSSDKEEDLLDALTIYQGEYLRESCDTNSIISTRERIHEAYNKAAYKLASMYFQQEHWDAAIKISHEILVQDSCNESAFRILMKSHAARGNRSAVISVYQRCCTALRNEMDVSPSRETTTLFNQLKQ